MTLILKSDQIVNDPDNRFPIITDMGEATVNVFNYKKSIELVDGHLTQQEFDALNVLDKGITNLGIQDSVLDINLALGDNLASKLIKFKGWKSNSLTQKNSFDSTNINNKGFVWNTAQGGGSRALGLGFNIQDVYDLGRGMNSIIYFKYNTSGTNPNATTFLFGSGSAIAFDINSVGLSMQVGNGQLNNRILNSASATSGYDARVGSVLTTSLFSWDIDKKTTYRGIYNYQTKIIDSTSVVQITPGNAMSQELCIGANNSSSNIVYNFYGQIGLAVFTKGDISTNDMLSLSDLLNQFITQSNKSYE